MPIPHDYEERVYAGVLGKIIGVYLGRPFEGWTYERIMRELGEVDDYVHEKLGKPLIVTDDDISGTFTFLRALPDHGNRPDLTPAQIGETWLNYIIENRTILAWGGMGNLTEHTAYLRLKNGIEAPRSGSIELNGKIIAEQIGAQIFIDGWGMVAPGDPELAASLARRAASVSHDGEAIYAAQVIAVMEAQAFIEKDTQQLLDTALIYIPRDSVISRLIHDLREWRCQEGDWRRARERLEANYGYDKYRGNCHVVPNHGLIILGLLYGEDLFRRSLMIVNTCGWDTDCNSGNLGCLLGIKNGLAGIDAGPDWRGPVADRLFLPCADGGRAITDALTETYHIVNIGRALAGEAPIKPKEGALYHFELPGAVQGFQLESDSKVQAKLENVLGHSCLGQRSLAIHYSQLGPSEAVWVATDTFIPAEAIEVPGYPLLASPRLYPGQVVSAALSADRSNASAITCQLSIRSYGPQDKLVFTRGPKATLKPGAGHTFEWRIEDMGGAPIAEIGLELSSPQKRKGVVYLDYLTWEGLPDVTFTRPAEGESLWRRAWVDAVDRFVLNSPEPVRIVQNSGRGMLIQGTREWSDYEVRAEIVPHLVASFGIAARVQGMRRYYALLLCDDGKVRLVKVMHKERILGEKKFPWEFERPHEFRLQVDGMQLQGWVDGDLIFDIMDCDSPFIDGGIAFVCEEGCISSDGMAVHPILPDDTPQQ